MAVANQKGGVGKTTTPSTSGLPLCRNRGSRVLLVDLDPQSNATTGPSVFPSRDVEASVYDALLHNVPLADVVLELDVPGLSLVPSSLALAGAEIELVTAFSPRRTVCSGPSNRFLSYYDWILMDCPPALGLLTVTHSWPADEVLVPIQCDDFALEGLGQLVGNVDLVEGQPEFRPEWLDELSWSC
jgi:chromosome partitioning protein